MINPFKSKKGLGRGLSSLIGDSDVKTLNSNISISSIVPNKYQPRKNFEKESLEDLTKSIKERGIIQPLIVRKSSNNNGQFEIIAGERRWQAAQNAGLHDVPVMIIEADNLKSLEFAIIENIQRKDLNPIEEAQGYKRLIDEFNYDQDKVSKFVGKSRSHVTNTLRLLNLPEKVQRSLINGDISQGHAKILVGIHNSEIICEKIKLKKLSVRQAETLVRLSKFSSTKSNKIKDINITNFEKELMEKIGMRVNISNRNNKGTILFEYKELEQLNKLVKVIKDNY